MATDSIVYPLRYELMRRSPKGGIGLIDAEGHCVAKCDDTSDFEMQHVVTRLNFAAAVMAKMKSHGFEDLGYKGRVGDGSREFNSWEEAVEACVDMALEDR